MRVLTKIENENKLDLIDHKILYLLSINARFSYSTISKQINLSREATKKRLDKLLQNKVLLGFQTVIDTHIMGLTSHHIFSEMKNPIGENKEKLTKELNEDNDINAVIEYTGKYDFEISVQTKDIRKLKTKLQKLSKYDLRNININTLLDSIVSQTYPKCIKDIDLKEISATHDGSFQNYFLKSIKNNVNLDLLDYKILEELNENARINMVELSTKINSSVDTCINRIKKMIKNKTIVKFQPIINYSALGFTVYTVLFKFKKYDNQSEKLFNEYLKNHRNILWSVNCIGSYNNITYIIIKDSSQYHSIINEIRNKYNDIIESYDNILSHIEHKYTYYPKKFNVD